MTGANSGTHGHLRLHRHQAKSYESRYPNFLDVKAPHPVGPAHGQGQDLHRHQPALDLPGRKIEGVLVSLVALELAKAVWPMTYRASLEQMGYQIEHRHRQVAGSPEVLCRS